MEVVLSLGAQRAQSATRFKQRGAKPLGEFPKWLPLPEGPRVGPTVQIVRRNELGVHGEGDRRRQIELIDLLTDITRDERDGRLHFWHDTLSFLDAFQTALAESFVLSNGANLLNVLLDI